MVEKLEKIEKPQKRQRRSAALSDWSLEAAAELYQIDAWSAGYFALNDKGHVVVRPDTSSATEIDLHEVVEGLRQRSYSTPVLIRFSDILEHRLKRIHEAFARAIAEHDYAGRFLAVYPIKVNQQRPVVEEIYRYGRPFDFGLEVGSKPELLAVMALVGDELQRPVICNGFKDEGYIEAVVLAKKLGRKVIPVVESFDELRLILKLAKKHGVRPTLGVRVKLASQGTGRWGGSAGDKSKFGLFMSEVVEMFDLLEREGLQDALQLVHCHPGSQVQDIRFLVDALNELANVYAQLVSMGAGLRYIDVGGGLAVDYLGTQTNVESSMNYTVDEYAADVVHRIGSVCDQAGVEHPTIITESGRAIVAFHSVLVFDVVGSAGSSIVREVEPRESPPAGETRLPQPILDLYDALESVSESRALECYHDAEKARDEAVQLFSLGYMGLRLRGLADRLFRAVCTRVRDAVADRDPIPEELAELERILNDTYFCNLSVFQSLPDVWAIGQVFPIVPIHRLNERPTRRAVLADITCDSDGEIDCFVDRQESADTLFVHELTPGEPYYLAAFLVGAYQETLGDLHNLFGDTHVAHIRLDERNEWWIEEVLRGDSARTVLGYMGYDVARLLARLTQDCERAVRDGRMSLEESQALLRFYEAELSGYTYLEPD